MRQVLLSYVCVFVGGGGVGGGSIFSNGIIIIMSHNINPLYFAAGSCVAMYCSYMTYNNAVDLLHRIQEVVSYCLLG